MTKTQNCKTCGKLFDAPAFEVRGILSTFMVECEPCNSMRRINHDARAEAEARQRRKDHWHEVCPPEMREWQDGRIGGMLAHLAQAHCITDAEGLAIIGPTRSGKTRAAYQVLRRAHEAGMWVESMTGTAFGGYVMATFSDDGMTAATAKEALRAAKRCNVLLLDDLGKLPTTARNAAELWDLVDYRCNYQRPIIWTSDNGGAALQAALGGDTGAATLARLMEFCRVVRL